MNYVSNKMHWFTDYVTAGIGGLICTSQATYNNGTLISIRAKTNTVEFVWVQVLLVEQPCLISAFEDLKYARVHIIKWTFHLFIYHCNVYLDGFYDLFIPFWSCFCCFYEKN